MSDRHTTLAQMDALLAARTPSLDHLDDYMANLIDLQRAVLVGLDLTPEQIDMAMMPLLTMQALVADMLLAAKGESAHE